MSVRRAAASLAVLVALIFGGMPAGAQTLAWPSEGPPRPLAAPSVKFPPYHLQTLPNGLQLVVVLQHEQPMVSMRMIVRAGGVLDPKDKLGMANLAASLLTQGTVKQSASEINETIDFIGGAMDAGAGTDLTFIQMVVMKDSFDLGLQMLADMARRPAMAPVEIDRQRQQILSSLQVNLDDPEFTADSVFRRLVYGIHPYGWPHSGTPDTIAAITRDDLLEFHRRYFVPNNTVMAVVGDITVEEAIEKVTRTLGDWERRELPAQTLVPPPDPTRRVVVVNKPDAVQTEIRVGQLGIKRNHPDYMALNLAIRILGGEGANRVQQVLRTERGLTYGAQAEMNAWRDTGDFEVTTNTRSEATGEALRVMVDEIWRLQRERVGERELAEAKNYMTGSFPLTIETPDAIATQILNVVFYGLPVEEIENFRERVNAVTTSDIQRVALFYLRPDRLSIVLVGDAATFIPQLRRFGFGTFESVDMDQLDLTTIDFKRPPRAAGAVAPAGRSGFRLVSAAFQQAPTITPQEGSAATTLLDQVITAKGGIETLRRIKGIVATTRAELRNPGDQSNPPMSADSVTYLEYPTRVRVETKLPNAAIVQVSDGSRAWVKDPNGVHDVPAEQLKELTDGLRRDTIALLLAARDGKVRTRALPDVKDDAGALYHALEFSANDLDPLIMYIDPKTRLIAKQSYIVAGPERALVEELFSDYRMVDGLQVAYRARVRRSGELVLDRLLTDIKINPVMSPTLFSRPAP